jgi:hypothetical protein
MEILGQLGRHADTSAAFTFPANSNASPLDRSSEYAL